MVWALAAAIIGAALLASAIPKLRDYQGLLVVVRGYRLLPPTLERATAAILPYAQLAAGLALLTGFAGRAAAGLAALMFLGFTAGLGINLLRGRREIDCGCFAFTEHSAPRISWLHAGRAGAFAAAALALAFFPQPETPLAQQIIAASIAGVVVAVAAAGAAVLAVVNPGKRPLDTHLTAEAFELRAAATISKYTP
jgi:hypothetical protein